MKQRTRRFGLSMLSFAESLPRSRSGNIIATQAGRSGTSVGANYRAACRARSRAEFASKIGVAEEEADESAYWIELAIDAGLVDPTDYADLLSEAEAITRMLAASRITAMKRAASQQSNTRATGRPTNRQSALGNRQSP
ncbi:MAG TPA: four helix bundle protein [Tepidisphaeraceae bacterium]|nr:four helix bundle protein [Tepidisphaeraceae bacterium]